MTTLLSWLKTPVDATLHVKGAPDGWYELDERLRPWPKKPTILAKAGGAGLAKRAPKIVAIKASGDLILRRSLVAPILASLPEVILRPAALASSSGAIVDQDFVHVDVIAHAPLERRNSDADWTRPKFPSASLLKRLRAATWSRPPRARIFRVGETWNEIAADESLAEQLKAATKSFFGVRAINPAELYQRSVHSNHPSATPDFEGDGAAAEEAYWRLEAGESGAALRQTACTSPIWGYWLARSEGKARPDTRKASLAHPITALLYAHFVDRKASKAAERAASRDWWSALYYAHLLARAIPKSFEKVLTEAGYDLSDEKKKIRDLWRFAR